jgi:hypothetical protein
MKVESLHLREGNEKIHKYLNKISVSIKILKGFTYRMQFTTNTARSDFIGTFGRMV